MSDWLKTEYQKKVLTHYTQVKADGDVESTIAEVFDRIIPLGVRDKVVLGHGANQQEELYSDLFYSRKAITGGRIMANGGGNGNGMLGNCFAQSIVDSREGIMECQANTFTIYAHGGGVGTNFSPLRPKGTEVKGVKSFSSGPCSFVTAFDGYAETIKQGSSNRRAAKMTILNVDHPDIEEFIVTKLAPNMWKNTNVSVGISDAFMEAVENDADWDLVFESKVYKTIKARELWNLICESAHKSAEPGLIYLDTINKVYPLRYLVTLQEVNPCQPVDSLIWDYDRLRYITDQNAKTWTSWCTGVKECVEVETNTGLKMKSTLDHKYMLHDGSWCEAKDLVGKQLKQPNEWLDILQLDNVDTSIDQDQVVRGFLFGDGFLCGNGHGVSVKLDVNKEPEVATMLTNFGFCQQDNGAFYLNRTLVQERIDIDFLLSPVYDRVLPDDVLLGKPYSFLRGLYAANGSCNKTAGQISLKATCYSTVQKVQVLLGAMGIHASIATNPPTKVKWDNGEYVSKQSYNLQTPTSYGARFQKLIGFFAESKKANIRELSKNGVRVKVRTVTPIGEHEVWDYRMNEAPSHNYCQGSILKNCSELPLRPDEMCLLSSLILPTFVIERDGDTPPKFDWAGFSQAIQTLVMYMDALIDVTKYPLPKIGEVMLSGRPIGIGITGLADMLFKMELPYGETPKTLVFVDTLGKLLYATAKETSEKLAEELGTFPDYDADKADFPPRRNSVLLAIAPTGSVSGLVGCSYGIEPHFAPVITRNESLGVDMVSNKVIADYFAKTGETNFPAWTRFVGGADDKYILGVNDHLAILRVLAKHIDSAISKSINLPKTATVEDVSDVYMYCWKNGIKGVTVYVDGCREDQPITWGEGGTKPKDTTIDVEEVDVEFLPYPVDPKPRPQALQGTTYKVKFNYEQHSLFITINSYEGELYEIFFRINNSELQEYLNGISLTLTSLWRRGIDTTHLMEEFSEYESLSAGAFYPVKGGKKINLKSTLHAIAVVVKQHIAEMDSFGELFQRAEKSLSRLEELAGVVKEVSEVKFGKCPSCKEYSMIPVEGCETCTACGYSKCG